MSNERKLVSRNKREGQYVAGWLYNAKYCPKAYRQSGLLVERKSVRAGANHRLVVRFTPIGKTYYRLPREEV